MESPVNRTLQLAPETLNGIGVNLSTNIFTLTVRNALVLEAVRAEQVVSGVFIGADEGTSLHHGNGVIGSHSASNGGRDVRTNLAATFHNADDNCFVSCGNARSFDFHGAGAGVHVRCFAADVSFVSFDNAGQQVAALIHQLADLVTNAPSALVRNTKLTLQFLRAHAILGSGHKEHRKEPSAQLGAALVEDRTFARMDLVTAVSARVATASLNAVERVALTAALAETTVRVALVKDVIQASGVVRKLLGELVERVAFCFHADRIPDFSRA